jgi:protein-S-isoprenylcysteine O-methyltransferase Ste14
LLDGDVQRLLPPFLVLSLIVVSLAFGLAVPVVGPMSGWWRLTGVVPLIIGLLLNLGGAGLFARVETNIKTFNDPDKLVVEGLFRFTRNPMYLGFTFILIAVAVFVGSLTAWVGPVAFFLAASLWYIPFEEHRMAARFGPAYDRYRQRVPRWVGLGWGS